MSACADNEMLKYSVTRGCCQPVSTRIVDGLLAAIAPWQCVLCRQPGCGMDLCPGCLLDLPWPADACQRCALPLPPAQTLCGSCQSGISAVDYCIAALSYEYPVDRLITALKFQRRLYLARVLGELLTVRLAEAFAAGLLAQPEILLPVPLHPRRLAERSYNQAAEIALVPGNRYGLEVRPNLCRRIRATPPQTGLSRRARLRNLQGAFRLDGSVAGCRVAVVDDVITTGATTLQLARLCKANGAGEVQVWAVARTGV